MHRVSRLSRLSEEIAAGDRSLSPALTRGLPPHEVEQLVDAFCDRLARMSAEQRIRASRSGRFSRVERTIWAARYAEEVPLVNGEFEWIALAAADRD